MRAHTHTPLNFLSMAGCWARSWYTNIFCQSAGWLTRLLNDGSPLRPGLCFLPCGQHLWTCFCGRFSGILWRWPNHCNRLWCSCSSTSTSPVSSRMSAFLLLSHSITPTLSCRHFIWNAWSFLSSWYTEREAIVLEETLVRVYYHVLLEMFIQLYLLICLTHVQLWEILASWNGWKEIFDMRNGVPKGVHCELVIPADAQCLFVTLQVWDDGVLPNLQTLLAQ